MILAYGLNTQELAGGGGHLEKINERRKESDGWVCKDGLTNAFWEVLEKALSQTLGFSFWAESLGMEVPLFQEYIAK